jgi:hypothetical protein
MGQNGPQGRLDWSREEMDHGTTLIEELPAYGYSAPMWAAIMATI